MVCPAQGLAVSLTVRMLLDDRRCGQPAGSPPGALTGRTVRGFGRVRHVSAPCVLHALDSTGDTSLTWDVGQPQEVAAARELFTTLKGKGYLAYRVDGENREAIRKFDATAPKIVMTPQLVGG